MHASVLLSKLVADRRNPRRVKPEREAHKRLVASIRAFGLLEPLIVRPLENDDKEFQVIAGQRRLAALREVYRSGKDEPKVPCEVRKVNDATADALSLSENFAREAMHPLDEAEAFAKLASLDGKGADVIAIEFGVTANYVRQRMKLATLSSTVKAAYRDGTINTSIAEAFTAVPRERQEEIWTELNGHPRHAEQVRHVIASSWIDSSHAIFDFSSLTDAVVSRDLFSERILIERKAFMEEQAKALASEREAMIEDGWADVVVGQAAEIQDRLYTMDEPKKEFDPKTARRLEKLKGIREKIEEKFNQLDGNDQKESDALGERFEAVEKKEAEIIENAEEHFSEPTKAVATAFLLLGPDGKVRREFRVPRTKQKGTNGHGGANGTGRDSGEGDAVRPPTSDDLSDSQLATTFHQQAFAVREALLNNTAARKKILALILHDRVLGEALAVRHNANGTTLHANHSEGFTSQAFERLKEKRTQIDPFADKNHVEDYDGYAKLTELSDSELNSLIALLTVDCLTAHPVRQTRLVHKLAAELKVEFRKHWRPNAHWLASYQKIQLIHLMAELRGPVYNPGTEQRKKSELVEALDKLFTEAADGRLEDKKLANRLNEWLPVNLREVKPFIDR